MLETQTEQATIAKTILKYKTFESSELFEAWQNETNVAISQIQPIVTTAQAQTTSNDGSLPDLDMQLKISIFVTYWVR